MSMCATPSSNTNGARLKTDQLAQWINAEWIPAHPGPDWLVLNESTACAHNLVLERFDRDTDLAGGFRFQEHEPVEAEAAIAPVFEYNHKANITGRTGAFRLTFHAAETDQTVEVLMMAAYWTDEGHKIGVACVPADFLPVWTEFAAQCGRLSNSLYPQPKVRIIGGRSESFEPTTSWDEIILPDELKAELLNDVESFFTKGADIYKRLNLKPFRKLLLAGIPGTGKTMLCSALAKWAIEREFLVIYVSSADYCGAAFWKIEAALATAADSNLPTLILLEEMDAYLRDDDDKALVLNVLDGAESRENEKGTLLIATTNYPEAIDERVLKRPGRLDRVFIIPEVRDADYAERMLRRYLGDMWQDDHAIVAREMVGYPGAFIREVAIHAMTRVAFADEDALSVAVLDDSFNRLLDQITAKDDFLTAHRKNGFGFTLAAK
ncbi:MAG: ATP-binding protein [Anaerolineae bacterium]|nr:ATP-binding protein [Anaerolineae bacterium]